MTEIKHVNVSIRSLSFHFFFSPNRWVVGWEQVRALTFDGVGVGGDVITLKPNGLRQIDTELCFIQVRSPN